MRMRSKSFSKIVLPLLVVGALLFAAPQASARKTDKADKSHAEMMREVREFKIKYLIQECDIASDQQEEFIKTYYNLEDARVALAKETIEAKKALDKKATPTDEDYLRVAEMIADFHVKEGTLEKNYYLLFKKFLSPKQLYLLKTSEHKFNDKLMKMRNQKKR